MHKDQFGFVPQRSTIDALLEVSNFVKYTLDKKCFGLLISLDISGAFDGAWWPKIINQLYIKKCHGNLIKLTNDYFRQKGYSNT